MLVEYLQYELLDSLFKDATAAELSFIGGTAIRILHDSPRFSEDLDFDNFGLSFTRFESLLKTACRDMEYKGFLIEYRLILRMLKRSLDWIGLNFSGALASSSVSWI